MAETSPSTANSNNRGGRPKDWNDQRQRRLLRLYVFTTLPVQKILSVLEERAWKPGYVYVKIAPIAILFTPSNIIVTQEGRCQQVAASSDWP